MKKIIFLLISIVVLASCKTPKTLGEQYPAMYEEKPLTIAIMPPINQTTYAEAKDYFYTTMYTPLCEKGYYVYSPFLTMEMYQQESAYDAEMFLESDLASFREFMGADAAMFTIIKEWRKNVARAKIYVTIEYILRSTKTGQTLYNREGEITVDMSVKVGNGPIGLLASAVLTATISGLADKIIAGRKCNAFVLSDLPTGKYSDLYEKDAKNRAGKRFVKATVK